MDEAFKAKRLKMLKEAWDRVQKTKYEDIILEANFNEDDLNKEIEENSYTEKGSDSNE